MYLLIIGLGLAFLAWERIWPDQELPHSPLWWLRAMVANAAQLGVVLLAGETWDHYLHRASLFDIAAWQVAPWAEGALGYLVATFVYYVWHRARHVSNFLWLGLHQFHHSPVRIETITAFYKHPLELVANSVVSSLTSYTLLGLSIAGAAFVALFSAVSEFFYHMNVRTPRWVGYFIQRPEMHRIHHERGVHSSNFGDLPLWDMLFGTFRNPARFDGACGFDPPREQRVLDMLLFRDVNRAPVSDP